MNIYAEILGNIHMQPEWQEKLKDADIEYILLDQWTAQKSRLLAKGDKNNEYAIALKRNSQVLDGDIISYDSDTKQAVVIRIDLSPVLIIDMSGLAKKDMQSVIRISVELGHAIGNQHWPAVVKNTLVYVPLTVDQKVMLSVIDTHRIEGITYKFEKGMDVIPDLSPQEVRKLFGGASQEVHSHEHSSGHSHEHSHEGHSHSHKHDNHSHSHE